MDFLPLGFKFTHFYQLCEKGCGGFILFIPCQLQATLSSLLALCSWALAVLSATMTPVSSTHGDWVMGWVGECCSSQVPLPSLQPRSLMQEVSAHVFGCCPSGITFFFFLMAWCSIFWQPLIVSGRRANRAPCYSILASCRRMPFPKFFI